jgi:hypothetical protein
MALGRQTDQELELFRIVDRDHRPCGLGWATAGVAITSDASSADN